MKKIEDHHLVVEENLKMLQGDNAYRVKNQEYLEFLLDRDWQYNFSWLGRPIMQLPTDVYAIQQIIWDTKPDLIIETGIAHGGSLILSASMLAQLDMCDFLMENPDSEILTFNKKRKVIGIDIDIRPHNRAALEAHPLFSYLELIEGSSVSLDVWNNVYEQAKNFKKIMVMLDSNHTHEHVLKELEFCASLVSVGCYIIVWDSGLEDLSPTANAKVVARRDWGKGNNPKTALMKFLANNADKSDIKFEIDEALRVKLGISATSDGFLKRVN